MPCIDHVALQASLRLKVQAWSWNMKLPPMEDKWAPRGEKCIKKKRPTAGPYRPLEGSRCRDPPQQCGPFGTKIKISALHSKKIQYKLCSGLTMRPCKQATDSNIELTLWCKIQHPHTIKSKFQHKLCSGLTMWPCKQATDSNIELILWCKT
jgi:hypothetical protein